MTEENINLMLLKTKVQPNRCSKKDQRIKFTRWLLCVWKLPNLLSYTTSGPMENVSTDPWVTSLGYNEVNSDRRHPHSNSNNITDGNILKQYIQVDLYSEPHVPLL